MRSLILAACALGAAAAGTGCQCGGTLHGAEYGTLWITGETGRVMVLDAADGGWIGEVMVPDAGDGGHGSAIAPAPDLRTMYAADDGLGAVRAIDVATLQVEATFTGLARPGDVRPSPDGRRLYVAQAESNEIAVIDLHALTVQGVPANVTLPSRTRALWVTVSGELYVLNALSNTLVNMGGAGPRWALRVTTDPTAFVTTREGNVGYVAGAGAEELQQVHLAGAGSPDAGPSAPLGASPGWLSISPDDRWLVASAGGPDNTISVVDLTRALVERARVPVGNGRVAQSALSPDRAIAFVGVGLPPQISVVDLERLAVVSQYALPEAPRGVVYLPRLTGP